MFPLSPLLAVLVLTNAHQVTQATLLSRAGVRFDLTGTLVRQGRKEIKVKDASGSATFELRQDVDPPALSPGDTVRTVGTTTAYDRGIVLATCKSVTRLSPGVSHSSVAVATIYEVCAGNFDNCPVSVCGTIREVFRDEIEPDYIYFTLTDGNLSICATYQPDKGRFSADLERLTALTDSKVTVNATCSPCNRGYRRMVGRTLGISRTEDIKVVQPAPKDPFSAPPVEDLRHFSPQEILAMGRRRVVGTVIAICRDRRFFIREQGDEIRQIRPVEGALPKYGQVVEVCGLPETDLYRINLANARWRPANAPAIPERRPQSVTAETLLQDASGHPKINPMIHGLPVTMRGKVVGLPSGEKATALLFLQCGSYSIPVDAEATREALNDLRLDCEAEITGTCIVETESWRPFATFPHATGVTLAVRRPEDVRVLSYPPWWTAGRMMIVVGSLLAVILAFFIWNRILSRIIERRSRELLKEQVAHVSADLKVEERTRLAVELHDSLSQNLAGLACQIVAVRSAIGSSDIGGRLDTAEQMLLSCRTELKRCLWDLRGNALDEHNLTTAIVQTVRPVIGNARLTVRFNVPRSRLLDSTAHAILCIIRELTANAVRHGAASHVRVAGESHGDTLSFSICDDGSGFDPANAPGTETGHFGLAGIRERVERLAGTFDIRSSPRGGTRAEITIQLVQTGDGELTT